ncbi:MAG: hypothetical protein HKN45_05640, partial [Flavobacteriales bacterium]|nr:hypothetical protein [Flavobacteriales bacterium]
SEFSFIVSDDIGCTVIRSGTVECECLFSSAGEFTQATDTLNACIGENIEVIYDDSNEVLDPNDTRTFIIHDGDSNAIGNTLLVFSDISSGISFDPILNEDVVYWLTAVIANEDDNGIADLNDVCLSAASGIGIRFRSSPTASLSGSAAICAGEEAIFEIDLEGNGPWTVNVDLQGNPFAEYITDLSPLIVQTSQEGEYVVSSISDQYCNGVANGAVQVDIQALPSASISQGGEFCEGSGEGPLVEFTGDGPWELNYTVNGILDSIVIGNTPDVIPVFSGGTYSLVSVSDSNCDNDASGSVQVDMIPAPQAILTAGNPVCVGDSVPILIEFINGNFWSYSLSFDGSNSDTLTNSTGSTIIHASTSGSIELLYLENESCGAYEFPNTEIEIYELPSIEYSLSGDSICSGELVELTIESQGNIGLVEVELLINSDLQFISVSSEQWTASFFPEEDFNLTIGPVQDQITGCVDTTLIQFNVEVTEYPEVNPLDDHIVCSLDSTLLSTMAEEGVVYQWYAGGELLPSDNSSVSLSLENLTNESIEVDVLLVADRIGCITQELSHFIVDPLPEVLFSYNPQPVSAVNPVINLINLSAGSNTYLWTLDGDTLSNDISPSWLLEPDNPDEYIICLEATSSKAGCKNTFCMEVEILGDLSVYIPNSFSPNGDGLNDEFGPEILNADLRFYTFDIYDRGGSKVFSTNDVNEWWNGTEMNLGRESRSGLYNYVIVTRDKFRRDSKIFRGSITLIR